MRERKRDFVQAQSCQGSMQTSGMATEIFEELRMVSEGVYENHKRLILHDGCKLYMVESPLKMKVHSAPYSYGRPLLK